MAKAPDLNFILFKRRGEFFLAACRGEHKGCRVNLKTRKKLGPCEHCHICDDDETIGDVKRKLEKGDA